MGGFLNLGGVAAAMVVRHPVRALNALWVPSLQRPVLVAASATISAGAGQAGLIELVDVTDSGTPLALLYVEAGPTSGGEGAGQTLIALVPPGHQVSLVTTDIVGTPTYFLQYTTEVVL